MKKKKMPNRYAHYSVHCAVEHGPARSGTVQLNQHSPVQPSQPASQPASQPGPSAHNPVHKPMYIYVYVCSTNFKLRASESPLLQQQQRRAPPGTGRVHTRRRSLEVQDRVTWTPLSGFFLVSLLLSSSLFSSGMSVASAFFFTSVATSSCAYNGPARWVVSPHEEQHTSLRANG